MPWLLKETCHKAGIPLTLNMRKEYDHSYSFISTFMCDHIEWHGERLGLNVVEDRQLTARSCFVGSRERLILISFIRSARSASARVAATVANSSSFGPAQCADGYPGPEFPNRCKSCPPQPKDRSGLPSALNCRMGAFVERRWSDPTHEVANHLLAVGRGIGDADEPLSVSMSEMEITFAFHCLQRPRNRAKRSHQPTKQLARGWRLTSRQPRSKFQAGARLAD